MKVLTFVCNYLFLNRHFCPQFHWLLNLQRFTNAKIRINHITSLTNITALKYNQSQDPMLAKHLDNDKIHFYLSIDKVLTEDLLDKTVTFKFIVQTIKHRYPDVFNEIIRRSVELCNVLD